MGLEADSGAASEVEGGVDDAGDAAALAAAATDGILGDASPRPKPRARTTADRYRQRDSAR